MGEEIASITEDKALFRQCVTALDSFYSQTDIKDHIKALQQVEAKVFTRQIKDFESFKAELLNIKGLSLDALDSSNNATGKIVEEYYKLPIFSSITLKRESVVYSVHNKSPNPLNSWLSEVWDKENLDTPLRRLFISKNGNELVDARDNIDAILSIFFDSTISPIENETNNVNIKSKVAVVHPLGPLHKTNNPDFEGWMKVSIIKLSEVNDIIPAGLAKSLFEEDEGSVQKISYKGTSDVEKAKENEITRQFAYAIISSGANAKEDFYEVQPYAESTTDKSEVGAPILHVYSHTKSLISTTAEIDVIEEDDDLPSQNEYTNPGNVVQCYSDETNDVKLENHWKLLEAYAAEKKCGVAYKADFEDLINKPVDAIGHFKRVFFADKDVIQIFQRSTAAQRVAEIACLLKLRKKQHIGHIKQIIHDQNGAEMIGLTMPKYDMTLKQYLDQHVHPRLTSHQRMDIIVQIIKSIKAIHEEGVAHRDLSTVNFMVNPSKDETLADGSLKAHLYLIDFGKAIFFTPEDAKKWWVDSNEQHVYQNELKPRTPDELTIWCRNLPYVMARPDHGYRFYRSIQTLPKSGKDHAVLPYLINAPAEDVYSLGTLVWKIFAGVEPWPGVFDTDLKKLRETVSDNFRIDYLLERLMPGPVSTKLLKKFLRVNPEERRSASDILQWIEAPVVRDALLAEWNVATARADTTMSPISTPTIPDVRRTPKRGAASVDGDQSPPAKRGRSKPAAAKNAPKPRATKKKAADNEDQTMTEATLEGQSMGGPSAQGDAVNGESSETAVKPEPKKPKQYYIPTGKPVGRPRKKSKFKPTGRPKGSKNKVYYYVDENAENEAVAKENAEKEASTTQETPIQGTSTQEVPSEGTSSAQVAPIEGASTQVAPIEAASTTTAAAIVELQTTTTEVFKIAASTDVIMEEKPKETTSEDKPKEITSEDKPNDVIVNEESSSK